MKDEIKPHVVAAVIFFLSSMVSGFLASVINTGFAFWFVIVSLFTGIGCVILTAITVGIILDL